MSPRDGHQLEEGEIDDSDFHQDEVMMRDSYVKKEDEEDVKEEGECDTSDEDEPTTSK